MGRFIRVLAIALTLVLLLPDVSLLAQSRQGKGGKGQKSSSGQSLGGRNSGASTFTSGAKSSGGRSSGSAVTSSGGRTSSSGKGSSTGKGKSVQPQGNPVNSNPQPFFGMPIQGGRRNPATVDDVRGWR